MEQYGYSVVVGSEPMKQCGCVQRIYEEYIDVTATVEDGKERGDNKWQLILPLVSSKAFVTLVIKI